MRRALPMLTGALAASVSAVAPAAAADLVVRFDLPRQAVAEYHRPYVAIWLEGPAHEAAGTLAVWYETEREAHGRRYLKELRQWWRKAGRGLSLPADGITGATRAAGPQTVVFKSGGGALAALPPGAYTLVVEAAREVGDDETVRLPFVLPLTRGLADEASGASELGAVRLSVK